MEIIYGINSVMEALSSGDRKIFEILVATEHSPVMSIAKGLQVNLTSRKDLDRIAKGANHQGVIAKVSSYKYADLKELYDKDVVVMLDGVEDPQNLGSIIRTAFALADAGIIITEDRSASITPAVVKAPSGATERAKIARVVNLKQASLDMKKNGFWLIGLEAGEKQLIDSIPDYKKIVIVLGGEGTGIRPIVKKELDLKVSIPMKGAFNSLNVSQSATIALYELVCRKK